MFLNQYLLLLGEFDLDNFDNGAYNVIIWIMFLLATFISQVIIFNMLIAIMGDSYAKISEMREQAALKEKIQILCDYLRLVNDKEEKDNYLVFMKPDEQADEGWGGILSAMKKNLQRSVDVINKTMSKKFSNLNQDVGELRSTNTNITDKLEEVQSSIQKQEVNSTRDIYKVSKDLATTKKVLTDQLDKVEKTLETILGKLDEKDDKKSDKKSDKNSDSD